MEKSIRILVFLFLGLSVFGAGGPSTRRLLKNGIEFVTGDSRLPDPLRPFDEFKDLARAVKASVKETTGCRTLEEWEPIVVSDAHWSSVSPRLKQDGLKTGVLAVLAESNCVKVGYPARVVRLDRATGITTLLGWFLPTGIADRRPQFASQEEALLVSAGLADVEVPVAFVTGMVMTTVFSDQVGPYAPRMNGARMITRAQMESAIQDGTQIIDVRSKKQFDAAHVKGAIHVPYTPGARMGILDEYSNYAKNGDAFDIRRVKQDREQPVVLMGEGPESHGVYRAAVVLRSEGWKKVFVFFEGFNYFSSLLWTPPSTSNLFNVVTSVDQLDRLRTETTGLRVIDVRSAREFGEASLAAAVNVPFKERDDLRYRRAGVDGQALLAYGDEWAPPKEIAPTTPVVFVGEDRHDWRGYKAALIAKNAGFATVHWFRDGAAAWRLFSSFDPTQYPAIGTKSAEPTK